MAFCNKDSRICVIQIPYLCVYGYGSEARDWSKRSRCFRWKAKRWLVGILTCLLSGKIYSRNEMSVRSCENKSIVKFYADNSVCVGCFAWCSRNCIAKGLMVFFSVGKIHFFFVRPTIYTHTHTHTRFATGTCNLHSKKNGRKRDQNISINIYLKTSVTSGNILWLDFLKWGNGCSQKKFSAGSGSLGDGWPWDDTFLAGKHIFGGKSESTAFGAGFLERSFNKDLIYRRKSLCNCEGDRGRERGEGCARYLSKERKIPFLVGGKWGAKGVSYTGILCQILSEKFVIHAGGKKK